VKKTSCHDDKVKSGIFKGFLHRAKMICSNDYLADEIQFLVDVFVENGYNRDDLEKLVQLSNNSNENRANDSSSRFVSLPYIPGVSGKLKRIFMNAGLKVVFKSGRNLESILSHRNKPKLPYNSCPGCYRVPCLCGGHYIGQTKKRVNVRFREHEKAIFQGIAHDSALSDHSIQNCSQTVDWEKASMISTEPRYFKRCIREALEIQKEKVGKRKDKVINREAGLYVTSNTWLNLLEKISKYDP